MKLIFFDMDGVIFEETNFWMALHKAYGTYEEGKKLTDKYLLRNYAKLVDEVVGRLWKGKDAKPYYDLIKKAKYVKGIKPLIKALKKKGYKIVIVSSGPKDLALRAKKELGIDKVYTNELVIRDGKITGEFKWPIGAHRKQVVLKEICREENIFFKDCVAVVHEDNDIKMAKTAGITIGFNPKGEVRKYCNYTAKDLKEILEYAK